MLRLIDSDIALSDTELLTALLEDISPVYDSNDTAARLLDRYKSFAGVCAAPSAELIGTEGVGERGALLIKLCQAAVKNLIRENGSDGKRRLFTHDELADYLRPYFINERVEKLYMLSLNPKYRVLGIKLIAKGDTDRLVFDKRLIIDEAVGRSADSVVLAHNHFTSTLPSAEDVILTNDISELLSRMGIKLHDHIIFCENSCKSMRRSGYIKQRGSGLL